jgi:hypothetical protein
MPLDLSKLTDAVGKVAALATSHATVVAARDAALADLATAQADVDALVAQLVAAAATPAEAAGLTAVAEALVAPVPVEAPVQPALGPVVIPQTFLPGDPRALV